MRELLPSKEEGGIKIELVWIILLGVGVWVWWDF